MAVATLKGPFNSEYRVSNKMEGKPSGRRRVFVQTETGCVLGVELDRADNAHTVKRRLQLALNVPTEERSLMYGDTVLKNDLSAVRNDSPLLLTRTFLHRSSSTPCLSPTGRELVERDQSRPIEILGCSDYTFRTKQLVMEVVEAIKNGIDPIPVHSGLGGAYYFRNCSGENVAIVKPTDEEPFAPNNPKGFVGKALGQPGLKRSVRVGETGFREVAAYLLDYDNFANVPPTALVKITHSVFNINNGVNGSKHNHKRNQVSKIASFQQYIPHDFDASDHGTSSFPVSAVHRIGILDVRILNTDRHAGNLLVKLDGVGRFDQVELVPIDHGLCLPENLEDPYFEWIHWPQASIPFSEDELKYINNLDPFRDSEVLRMELPMIREACLRVFVLCTIFLKEAAGFGFCLAEIGQMMSREFCGCEEEPSELEVICLEARRILEEKKMPSQRKDEDDEFQFSLDCEDEFCPYRILESKETFHVDSNGGNGRNLLSKIEERDECAWDKETESDDCRDKVGKLSMPTKQISLSEETGGCLAGNKSDEHMAGSTSFVKLSDMNDEDWPLFLDNFHELLYPAFVDRRSVTLQQRQRQRLGTSCRF